MINPVCVESVFQRSLKLKKSESCLIVTDTAKEGFARQLYKYARSQGSPSEIVVMEPTLEHGVEPPAAIAGLMLKFDVQVLVTEKSLSHTKARRDASLKGARIASMPTITESTANRCLDVDYEALREVCARLHGTLSKARLVTITTELGTSMEAALVDAGGTRREVFGENGGILDRKGDFGNLPEGEISFSPADCHGIYIVDATFPGIGKLTSPLEFRVENGYVVDIKGEHSDSVRSRIDLAGPNAYLVAEVGIGTNPKAMITGSVLEDEKVLGTAHVAVGNNLSYGGNNDVPLHLDGVISAPDIICDGKRIMTKGKANW
ncbi:MAG: aminopeptidase [Candidatus Omnitrophota bacterium]